MDKHKNNYNYKSVSRSKKHKTIKKTNKTNKTIKKTKYNKIDKKCSQYKTDIDNKPTTKLHKSCKMYQYCKKKKCYDIDNEIQDYIKNKLGVNYKSIIFDKIQSECINKNNIGNIGNIGNIENNSDKHDKTNKNMKQCEQNALKSLYKENNMYDLYKKIIKCDKVICSKEKKIFNTNLFREDKIKLKNKEKNIIINQNLFEDD